MTAFITRNRRTIVVWAALALILVVGGAFRFQALDWDQGQYFHPDERAIIQHTLWLNEIPLTTDEYGARQHVDFPPGGLGFFIPNSKSNLRPATPEEADAYNKAKASGQPASLPANVQPPDQPLPADAINFWNANFSPLNPHWFPYGSFPMYLIKFGGHIMSAVTGQVWYDWEHLTLIGRFLSGLFSLGTVLLVFLLGRQIFAPSLGRNRGDAIGLLAAAFMAVSVLDIQLAHFAAFDVELTFFMTLALYMAVRLMRSGKWTTATGLGAAIGLALACKVSAASVVLPAVVAALLYGLYGRAKESGEFAGKPRMQALPGPEADRYGPEGVALGPRLITGTLLNLIIAGVVTLVVWFVAMPYAFLDFANWSARVIEEAGISRGSSDIPYTRQYVGTIPFLYQAGNLAQWGVGIPLGILAGIGLGYSLWQSVARRLKAELVLVTYLLVYSLTTFTAESKFDRYLLPVLPVLLLLAARFVVVLATPKRLAEHHFTAPRRRRNWPPFRTWAMSAIALVAFGWAGVWALAFSQIYSVEHTMNQATRWMYQNMPNGSSYSNEIWDESLPTRIVDDQNIASKGWCDPETLSQNGNCVPISMDLYGDQPNDAKVDYFVNQLKKTDYITIASNRLYATMAKLPWRYPIQIRYYELLFSGKLGYQQVATFTDYPTIPILNWQINDDSADESFTVYDHPKVFIFKKTQKLTDEEIRGLFANAAKAPWVPKRYPGPNDLPFRYAGQGDGVLDSATAGQYRADGKTLLLDRPVDRLPVVDDMGWFQFANDNQWFAVILWFALMQLLGIVALPIAWRVCRRLPDRGYILAKPLGAVIVALVIWLLVWTRFFMNTVWTAWLALGLTAVFSAWLWWHNRRELTGWLLAHRRIIVIEEAIFLVVFAGWVVFRIGNPDLWHPFYGGEKPMEMTHMLGILRSAYFPPYDPWFSDGYINYYYYGQYLVATWVKLSGISPFIAFNLALPSLYAFTCTGAYSLVFNITLKYKRHRARLDQNVNPDSTKGPVFAGLFGVLIFAFAGNMDGFLQVLQRFKPVADLATKLNLYPDPVETLKKFDYFRSSRVIPGTINEFPAFSFIYADLHAHVAALPYTIVAMGLAFNLLCTNWLGHTETRADGRLSLFQMTIGRLWHIFDRTLVTPVIIMVVIGYLGATNSWDLPTYLLLVTAGVFMALFRRYFTPRQEIDEEVSENGLALDMPAASYQPPATSRGNIFNPKLTLPSLLIDLVLTGAVAGVILAGSLGLYWNFFGNFYAFYSKIELLPDRLDTSSYENISFISARTEFKYFIVIYLLPLFLVVSYLFWNGFNWWGFRLRSPRAYPPEEDYAEGEYDDELDDYEQPAPGRVTQPEAVQPTLPGFGLSLKRPELALSLAGADGGSNSGWGSGPGFGAASSGPASNRFAKPWLIGLIAFSIFMIVVGMVTPNNWLVFLMMVSLIAVCLVFTFVRPFDKRHPEQSAEAQDESGMFLRVMLIAAFGLIAACEVIYLADDMGPGEYTRMNTVFKFYYQVWALFCLAAAAAAYVLWVRWIAPTVTRPGLRTMGSRAWRFAWIGATALIVFCVMLYPVQAIPSRLQDRGSDPIPPPTLDGRAYFKNLNYVSGMPAMTPGKVFDLTLDAQSLFEFYDKIKGTPVVLEASIWPYRGGGSWIPINTGLPTLLGWDHHERQQRWPGMVSNRSDTGAEYGIIRQIYNTSSIQEALELLNHFHVTYIHVGTIEREGETYAPCDGNTQQCPQYEPFMSDEGYAKFEQMVKLGLLDVAYQNPGVVVYKMTAKGESGVITGDIQSAGVVSITDPKLTKLEAAVKASPNNPQNHYNLSQYYYTKHDYQKAAAEMQTVIQLEPNRVNPYHVLGDIYRDSGDNAKALEQYQKATQIQAPPEEMPAAFNKYGVALLQVGRNEEAIQQFEQTIKLNKYFNEAYYHEGEAYEALGKKDAAIQAYQQTVVNSQQKNDFWTQRANQKIRELSGK